ncbi:hypothetical protein ACIQD1_31270 [Streptomyces sp. NPDC093088]|uniref:hypothetical protein n=1 Tax=Streptomyces sp. NPDC093088 TaxID=3366023 RepID=UPI00382831F5
MPKLTPPSLPPGPRQTLGAELHTLHRRAGWPSVRDLARALGTGVASSSRIHDAFTKPRLPAWGLVQLLVTELARRIPRADPERETERFHALWEAAAEASAEITGTPTAPVDRSRQPQTSDLPVVTPSSSGGASRDTERVRFRDRRHHRMTEQNMELLHRVNNYLRALSDEEYTEFTEDQIRIDMKSLLTEKVNYLTQPFRVVRERLDSLRDSTTDSRVRAYVDSQFGELSALEFKYLALHQECRDFYNVREFTKAFARLARKCDALHLELMGIGAFPSGDS